MPILAGADGALRLAPLFEVRDQENVRVVGQCELFQDMAFRGTEAATERDLGLRRQVLVAKDQDRVIHEGLMDLTEQVVADLVGQVDAGDLRPDGRAKLFDFDSHGRVSRRRRRCALRCFPGAASGRKFAGP